VQKIAVGITIFHHAINIFLFKKIAAKKSCRPTLFSIACLNQAALPSGIPAGMRARMVTSDLLLFCAAMLREALDFDIP
jgi:hypothetical protein